MARWRHHQESDESLARTLETVRCMQEVPSSSPTEQGSPGVQQRYRMLHSDPCRHPHSGSRHQKVREPRCPLSRRFPGIRMIKTGEDTSRSSFHRVGSVPGIFNRPRTSLTQMAFRDPPPSPRQVLVKPSPFDGRLAGTPCLARHSFRLSSLLKSISSMFCWESNTDKT